MILITGANGQSGSEIVKALASKGAKFKAHVRNPAKADNIRLPGVELVTGDLADASSLAAALAGVDVLLLNSGPSPEIATLQNGVIAAAKKAGVKRIVKFSAAGIEHASVSRFARLHGEVEKTLMGSGMAWTIIRPPFFMENLLTMVGMIKGGTLYQPTGNGRAPFVALEDVGRSCAAALLEDRHAGQIYSITGPQDLNWSDIAAACGKLVGKPVHFVDVPAATAAQGMVGAGVPQWAADGINELSALMKSGAFAGPSDAVLKLTGKPPVTLEIWLTNHASSFR